MIDARNCVACGRPAEWLCLRCARQLLPPALPLPDPPGTATCRALVAYEGVGRSVVLALKHGAGPGLAAWLAPAMARLVSPPWGPPGRTVTWAPTAARRRRRRGYDQAALVARAVARELGLPHRGLLRRLPGPPQQARTRAERDGAPLFAYRRGTAGTGLGDRGGLILVDDVITTGSTLGAAASTLAAAGWGPIAALAVAATPAPDPAPAPAPSAVPDCHSR